MRLAAALIYLSSVARVAAIGYPARSTAELAVVGVVVGTKAHLSAIHRRSFPSLKLATPSMDEGDVASSFVPGTVRAGRHRTLRSTLAFISPTAGRECSLCHR